MRLLRSAFFAVAGQLDQRSPFAPFKDTPTQQIDVWAVAAFGVPA